MAMSKCPHCGNSIKAENLSRHLKAVHPGKANASALREADRKAAKATRSTSAAKPSRIRQGRRWALPVALVLILIAGGGAAVVLTSLPPAPDSRLTDPVATICLPNEGTALHIHPHLAIQINGQNYPVPAGIGVPTSQPNGQDTCLRMVHTHDSDGLIHVESPVIRDFYLRDFFAIWKKAFSATQILDYTGPVSMTVDGVPSTAYGDLLLQDGQQIVITYG